MHGSAGDTSTDSVRHRGSTRPRAPTLTGGRGDVPPPAATPAPRTAPAAEPTAAVREASQCRERPRGPYLVQQRQVHRGVVGLQLEVPWF